MILFKDIRPVVDLGQQKVHISSVSAFPNSLQLPVPSTNNILGAFLHYSREANTQLSQTSDSLESNEKITSNSSSFIFIILNKREA